MNGPVRLAFTITGRVQGVSFRAFTAQTAQRLRLTGWARNLPDTRFEIRR